MNVYNKNYGWQVSIACLLDWFGLCDNVSFIGQDTILVMDIHIHVVCTE